MDYTVYILPVLLLVAYIQGIYMYCNYVDGQM
jgi:hypothetical protein